MSGRHEAPDRPGSLGSWLSTVAFVVLVLAALLADTRPSPAMRGVALTLLALGAVFAGLPFFQLRRLGAVPPGATYMDTTAVARRGLYALVRHPQYLGYDLLAWGFAALAPHWGTVIPAMLVTAGGSIQARAEERFLLAKFGDDYRAYRLSVPRFGLFTGLFRYVHRLIRRS